jgi:hypothetical protein
LKYFLWAILLTRIVVDAIWVACAREGDFGLALRSAPFLGGNFGGCVLPCMAIFPGDTFGGG